MQLPHGITNLLRGPAPKRATTVTAAHGAPRRARPAVLPTRRQVRGSAGALALLATVLTLVLAASPASAAISGTVTGTVFRDFDGDGTMDAAVNTTAATDVGVAGVVVKAYSDTGAQVGTATTSATGTYSLPYSGAGTVNQVRIEFATPNGYRSTAVGSAGTIRSGSSVQFKTNAETANYGVARAGDYSQESPTLVVPVHHGLQSNRTLAPADTPTLMALDYGTLGYPTIGTAAANQRTQATLGQTGTVWGTAPYFASHVFSGALFKRHTAVGPKGLGAIYVTTMNPVGSPASPNASLFVELPNAGTNPRQPVGTPSQTGDAGLVGYDWFHDAAAYPQVGRIGLGDVDIAPDGRTLYAVNLNDRKLYAVPVNAPATAAAKPTAGTPVGIALPTNLPGGTACADAQVRPFGLNVDGQYVYVSLTCAGPAKADLRAYVYRYDRAAGTFATAPTLDVAISGPRGKTWTGGGGADAAWNPWTNTWQNLYGNTSGYLSFPQPEAADIAFDSNGDLTLAIKDRLGDQGGMDSGNLTAGNTSTYETFNGGDILRACAATPGGAFVLESNGSCGSRTGVGVGNNDGPGGGEYYQDDYGTGHQQIALGSAHQVPGFSQIIATMFDPSTNVRTGGYRRLNNSDGAGPDTTGTQLTGDGRGASADGDDRRVGTFGKADGIGDIESLVQETPLQIGNRVWDDVDRDGLQDPGEAPIAGVTVHLYDGATLVATKTTDPSGQYLFGTADGLKPNTAYRIALDKVSDFASGGPLNHRQLTVANAGTPATDDDIDSDGQLGSGGRPEIAYTTGDPGADDHTLDFGFNPLRFDLALRKTLKTGQSATVEPGDDVTFTVQVFNQGEIPATAIQVTDTLPPGTTLHDAAWTSALAGTAATRTIAGPLAPGASTTVDITLTVTRPAPNGTIVNTAEISAAKDDNGNTPVDIDSTPDTNAANDELVDDVINDNPTTGTDEDDHDIAQVTYDTFDLALRKTLAPGQTTPVEPGDDATFRIRVFNQGSKTATAIVLTDTLPTGTTLNDPAWTSTGPATASRTIAGPLAPGASTTVDITVTVGRPAPNGTITNTAEISDARDSVGNVVSDIDSTPDTDPVNDELVDDEINDNPITGTDEDDHDIAVLPLSTPAFDLALRKQLAPGQPAVVRQGQAASFRITVFNQGAAPAQNIKVSDAMPAGTTFDPAQNPGWTLVAGQPTITIAGPLAAGASTFVDLKLTVASATAPGTLTNTAEISAAEDRFGLPGNDIDSTPDTNPGNDILIDDEITKTPATGDEDDHDIAKITVPAFDLALRKTVGGSGIVAPNQLVPFTIEVFNQGQIPAANVVVTDTLPTGLSFDPAQNPGWTMVAGQPTTTIAGPIAAGASTTVTLKLTVATTDASKTLVNNAEISAATDELGVVRTDIDSTPDVDATNDKLVNDVIDQNPTTGDDEDDHDVAVVRLFDLALRKTTTATRAQVGDTVTFSIDVFNQGQVAADSITLTDYLPAQMTLATTGNTGWTDNGDGTATYTSATTLAPGASRTIDIRLKVTQNAARIDNYAEISAATGPGGVAVTDADSTPDTIKGNDTLVDNVIDNTGGDEDDHDIASVTADPFDLALRKTTTATNVAPGELVPFTITVFNQGQQAATTIVIADTIPVGMTFDPADNPGWALVGAQPTTTIAGPLAIGANTSVTIKLRVAANAKASTLVNTAEIISAVDESGRPAVDIDSIGDTDATNDALVDDVIDNDQGDEDDHDIAKVTVERFDLALRKTLKTGQSATVEPGDPASFTITVFNQGQVAAKNITVTDRLPAGTTLADPAWTDNGDGTVTRTIAGPLAPGASTPVDLNVLVNRPAANGTITNTAEISSATDTNGVARVDEDSTPDTDLGNDVLIDDEINKTPATGDEDDHDIATLTLDTPPFDLALRDTLAPGQASLVRPGQDATFRITVFNQGSADATSVQVTTRIPAGTTLHDSDWTDNGDGTATITLPGTLAAGGQTFVDLTVTVGATTAPGLLTDTAEISAANDRFGGAGNDIDSTPDANLVNDVLIDDEITKTPATGDEDDHDIAQITVPTYDVALRKTTASDIVAPGEQVPFTITVFNQGQIPAADVVLTDTIPAGFSFDPAVNPGWTLSGTQATRTVAGPIAPGAQASTTISLKVLPSTNPQDYRNIAEISASTDELGIVRPDIDSTPDTDATNDALIDDEITKTPATGDEDDHDVASVRVFDLALRKTTAAGQVQVGDVVPFTIEVFNQGTVPATAVQVVDHVPAQLAFDAAANPTWTEVGGNPTTTVAGTIAPGASATVTINLRVVTNGTQITNVAEIASAKGPNGVSVTDLDSTPDTDGDNDGTIVDNEIGNNGGDEDDHDIAVIGSPTFDLALRETLADGQASVVWPGDDVNFTIRVFNQGEQAGHDIVVTERPPAGFHFESAKNPGWTVVDGQPTRTVPGTLAPGADTAIGIVLTVDADAVPGTLTDTSEISAAKDTTDRPGHDLDSSPNTDLSDDVLVDDIIDNTGGDEDDHDIASVTVPTFDLALRKTLADGQPSTAYLGEDVHFAITVFNQGSVDATDVVVTDTPPAGMSFDPAANPGWTMVDGQPTTTLAGPITPGGQATVGLTLRVTANAATLVNNAEISQAADKDGIVRPDLDSTPDVDPGNDPTTDDVIDGTNGDEDDHDIAVVSAPTFDLALRKTLAADQPATVYVGQTVTYTITVFNQGEVAAANIDIVDDLPAGTSFDPAINPDWTLDGTTLRTTIVGPLAPGASAAVELRLAVTADAGTQVDNRAEISRAEDTTGRTPPDVDSTPDTNLTNDELDDDVIDKTPATGDEDDHDIATVGTPRWDLALRKTLRTGQATTVKPGSTVWFTVTVFNQGDRAAYDVSVLDTPPAGLTFDAAQSDGWAMTDSELTATLPGPIPAGGSSSIDVAFTLNAAYGATLVNEAEITRAVDVDGVEPPDIDSVPDADPTNDELTDDVIDQTPGTGDEDDADPAEIKVSEEEVVTTSTTSTVPGTPTTTPFGTPTTLARTGTDVGQLVLYAVELIGLGLALTWRRRRQLRRA